MIRTRTIVEKPRNKKHAISRGGVGTSCDRSTEVHRKCLEYGLEAPRRNCEGKIGILQRAEHREGWERQRRVP